MAEVSLEKIHREGGVVLADRIQDCPMLHTTSMHAVG
jgi:hypothetical protein